MGTVFQLCLSFLGLCEPLSGTNWDLAFVVREQERRELETIAGHSDVASYRPTQVGEQVYRNTRWVSVQDLVYERVKLKIELETGCIATHIHSVYSEHQKKILLTWEFTSVLTTDSVCLWKDISYTIF